MSSSKHFPHSLSFGGCSNHSLLQGTSYSSPCGNSPFGVSQPSAAASFFARAAQRLNLSAKKKKRDPERPEFRTNFRDVIKTHPPPVPPGLLRLTGRKEVTGVGKVKVMLRMCPPNEASCGADASYMSVDGRKKQVTLYDPTVCGGGQDTHVLAASAASSRKAALSAVGALNSLWFMSWDPKTGSSLKYTPGADPLPSVPATTHTHFNLQATLSLSREALHKDRTTHFNELVINVDDD